MLIVEKKKEIKPMVSYTSPIDLLFYLSKMQMDEQAHQDL